MDFFLRDGDETRLKNAQLADDMDLTYSRRSIGPWGPELVAVAMRSGAHVCWYCQELFDESRSAFRPVEVRHGYALILLHAGCIGKKPRTAQVVNDLVRGHQLRREATKVVKGSTNLELAKGPPSQLADEIFASIRETSADEVEAGSSEKDLLETQPMSTIVLAEGLDTVRPRETDPADNGDNSNT